MKVIRDPFNEKAVLPLRGGAVTIGNFDGVHLGHQYLLKQLVEHSAGAPAVVMTFDTLPEKILKQKKTLQILSQDEQFQYLSDLGIDAIILLKFDKELALLAARDFAQRYIFKPLSPKHIVLGHDFVFGHQRTGDFHLLESMGQNEGVSVSQVQAYKIEGEVVSSSRIRMLLLAGRIEQANQLLSRPYSLAGKIVSGKGLGRQIGYPTANLSFQKDLCLSHGVYICQALLKGRLVYGVCNVGVRPTVESANKVVVECHFLNTDEDLYGEPIYLSFLSKLRDELKFTNLEGLREQIALDVQQAADYVSRIQ